MNSISSNTVKSRIFIKDRLWGDILTSVPNKYEGSCAVSYFDDRDGRICEAVVPSFDIASRVAILANNKKEHNFYDVDINLAYGKPVTHDDYLSCIDWMAD